MTNPISQVQTVTRNDGASYKALVFWCPGCEYVGEDGETQGGAHMLPITGSGDIGAQPSWGFSGTEDCPTLSPSILSKVDFRRVNGEVVHLVCHSFMRNGQLEFLEDCNHQYAGQTIGLPPLPDWLVG